MSAHPNNSPEDTSEPAFPNHVTSGMTLRDYFAAKALPATQSHFLAIVDEGGIAGSEYAPLVARDCYQIADAMLAEKAKTLNK